MQDAAIAAIDARRFGETAMARSCTICARSDAGSINEKLGASSARALALELGLSHAALLRHQRNHQKSGYPDLRVHTVKSNRAEIFDDPLDELVAALRVRALAGNPADTREYRLALAAQSAAKHAAVPARDLATTDEWIALRSAILTALEPYADARRAVTVALTDLLRHGVTYFGEPH